MSRKELGHLSKEFSAAFCLIEPSVLYVEDNIVYYVSEMDGVTDKGCLSFKKFKRLLGMKKSDIFPKSQVETFILREDVYSITRDMVIENDEWFTSSDLVPYIEKGTYGVIKDGSFVSDGGPYVPRFICYLDKVAMSSVFTKKYNLALDNLRNGLCGGDEVVKLLSKTIKKNHILIDGVINANPRYWSIHFTFADLSTASLKLNTYSPNMYENIREVILKKLSKQQR